MLELPVLQMAFQIMSWGGLTKFSVKYILVQWVNFQFGPTILQEVNFQVTPVGEEEIFLPFKILLAEFRIKLT